MERIELMMSTQQFINGWKRTYTGISLNNCWESVILLSLMLAELIRNVNIKIRFKEAHSAAGGGGSSGTDCV